MARSGGMTSEGELPERLRTFPIAAQNAFAFLVKLGYRCTKADEVDVEFTSAVSTVVIHYGRGSHELHVEAYPRSDAVAKLAPFTLSDLTRGDSPDTADGFRDPVGEDAATVASALEDLGKQWARFAGSFLSGDEKFLERLAARTREHQLKWGKDMELTSVRMSAELMWRRRNYQEVVALYRRIGGDLTAEETRRLSQAIEGLGA
jgi:hypothetical protein